MSDTNHHILTGKVDVTSNLLVGSSHLFVDTNNNRVGLITTDPHAGLHVNSNAYVHADLRVGSQIEINATAGRIKADKFEGDGSLLVNAPVGSLAVHSTDTGVAGSDALVSNEGTPTAANFKFTIPRGDTGAQGIQGNTGTSAIGSVTTGNPGSQATVVNSGTSTDATLDFTIPRGDVGAQGIQGVQGVQGIQGIQGNTGTVAVHSTDTGVAGSQASVSNEGTSTVADFKFTIPRGDTGDQGIQGDQGVQGPAATIAVSTPTTTGAAGTNASVTNSGSSSAATFNFTIPRGDTGAQGIQGVQGPAATVAVGTTTTGAAGTNASVTNAGSSSAATFNFIIPQGADGSDGADGTNYFTLSGSDIYRSTGNVGIGGTASATNRLKVDGTVEATTFTGSLSTSVTPGSYLTGSAYNGSTARTFTVDATTAATASKIVARDGSGDIFGRYMNMSHGATARNSDTVFYSSTDNYIRKTTAAGMRSSLGVAALAGSTTQAFSVSTLTTTGNVGVTGDIGKNWGTGRFIMNYDDSYRQGIHFSTADRTMSLFSTTNDSGGAIAFKTRGGTGSSDTDYGTERMRIDKDGNVGIGTISPSAKLHVYDSGAASGWQNFYVRPTSLWGDGLTTASETAGTKYMTMNMVMIQAPHITPSSTGQDAYIRYGRAGGIQSGIWWETACVTDGSFRIRREANNSYGMTIDSSGNVGIGVTDPDNKLEVRGTIQASASDANHGMFLDHNGTIRRDYGFGGVGLHFTGDAIWPTDRYGTYANNQIDLGNTLRRWKTIWTTNALNSTSDDRLKHNEEEVVDALGTIKKLKLLKYDKTGEMLAPDYNGDLTGISHRKELGFIAQSVLEIPELSFLVTVPGDPEDELEHGVKRGVEPYGMEYQGINNLLVQAVQEVDRQLQAEKEKTQQLEVRLSLLESTLASLIS